MLSIKQMSHALALRNHENFRQAAKSVNISQPAFSHSIGSLEEQLGVTLFNRGNGGKVTPTVYGQALLRRAEKVLADTEAMVREIDLLRGMETGRLSLAMGIYAAEISANRALAKLVAKHPKIEYASQMAHWHNIPHLILSSTVDLGVAETSALSGHPHLQAEPVGSPKVVFYVRSDHPLLGKKHVTRSDMSRFPLAAVIPPARVAEFVPGRVRLDPDTGYFIPSVHLNDISSARTVVLFSDAMGIAAPLQIEPWLRSGELAILPYWESWMKLQYGVIYPKGRLPSPSMEEFITLFREIDAQRVALNDALLCELME